MKDPINDHMVHVYSSMSIYNQKCFSIYRYQNCITPKHFIDCLTTYLKVLETTENYLNKQITRLSAATQKTVNASTQIDLMETEVKDTKLKVESSTEHCEKILRNIEECKLIFILS